MKLLFFCCFLLSSPVWAALTSTSTIHSVDIDDEGNNHFIKLDSGVVVFVDDIRIIEDLTASAAFDKKIQFDMDHNNELIYWHSVPEDMDNQESYVDVNQKQLTTSPVYSPSVVTGRASLASIFSGLRSDSKRRSECFHRAYIWAYEENRRSGRNLTKHFLFFTRQYIREYRYKWWFHVAPSALYAHEEGKQEFMVFDRNFTKSALPVKEWTDKFIASKRSCPVVYVYSHYNNHQESEHCYLMPTPMYYLQPLDMENFEKTGIEKRSFVPGDLNLSYRRGFSGRPL